MWDTIDVPRRAECFDAVDFCELFFSTSSRINSASSGSTRPERFSKLTTTRPKLSRSDGSVTSPIAFTALKPQRGGVCVCACE
jgi:hypothetical protein